MEIKKVIKSLAGKEDITTGIGSEVQKRNNLDVEITKLNATHLEGAIIVDTIKDMLNLPIEKLNENPKVYVLGYHEVNDGGGGLFVYNSELSEHNGGTKINKGKVWPEAWPDETWFNEEGLVLGTFERILENDYVTPEYFGAVGDGETDDTLPLQQAINFTYVFLQKVYKVTNISIDKTGTIIEGKRKLTYPELKNNTLSDGVIIIDNLKIGIDENNLLKGVRFRKCSIVITNTINIEASPEIEFYEVSIWTGDTTIDAFYIKEIWFLNFEKTDIFKDEDGENVRTGSGIIIENNIFLGGGIVNFLKCNIKGFASGIEILGVLSNVNFSRTAFKSCGTCVSLSNVKNAAITTCHFEGYTAFGVKINAQVKQANIQSSYFTTITETTTAIRVGEYDTDNTYYGVDIKDNSFYFIPKNSYGIKVFDSTNNGVCVISENAIHISTDDGGYGIQSTKSTEIINNVFGNNLSVDIVGDYNKFKNKFIVDDSHYNKKNCASYVLDSALFLNKTTPQYLFLQTDGDNAQAVYLPSLERGLYYLLKNEDDSNYINIRDNDGNIITTLEAGDKCEVFCDGIMWHVY